MSTKLEAAARQALEALEGSEALMSSMDVTHLLIYKDVEKAITDLREALAEQQAAEPATEADMAVYKAIADNYHASLPQAAEPVVQKRCHLCDCTGDIHSADGEWRGQCPYCKPTQQPLTDEQRDAARYRWLRENRATLLITGFFGNGCINRAIDEADQAIDAAIIKNGSKT